MAKKQYTSVDAYLADLPEDRRAFVGALMDVIRKNADKKIAEGIQYGMPAFFLPHEHYPAGYHCDPKIPLPFASVASTKAGASIYLFCTYCDEAERERVAREWKATGNRLDMGKSCIRVKKLEQVPLDVLGKAVKRMTAAKFVKAYEKNVPGAKR
jgi:hypothetical protein